MLRKSLRCKNDSQINEKCIKDLKFYMNFNIIYNILFDLIFKLFNHFNLQNVIRVITFQCAC